MYATLVVVDNQFRDWFRNARRKANLTQSQVADAVGVAQVTVSQWESGETRPREKNLAALARLFKVKYSQVQYLIGISQEPGPEGVEAATLTPAQQRVIEFLQQYDEAEIDNVLDALEIFLRGFRKAPGDKPQPRNAEQPKS